MAKSVVKMADGTEVEVVSQEDLMKAVQDLEGKKPEEKKPVERRIAETPMRKAADVVAGAKGELRKAIDASGALAELANVFGLHIDESLETLQKAVDAAAQRDMTFVTVLTELKKSVDELAEKIEEFGDKPAAKPRTVTTRPSAVLNKGVREEDGVEPVAITKTQLIDGLVSLAKACKDPQESGQLANAIATIEATGKISNEMLRKAVDETKRLAKAQ